MNIHSKDPNQVLPAELFTLLLSSLHPRSIATSSPVSANWRNAIKSTLTFQQEMSLSHLTSIGDGHRGVPSPQIIDWLLRLSSASSNRVVKVTLSLKEFQHDFQVGQEWESNTLSLPVTILELSKDTLKKEISLFGLEIRQAVLPLIRQLKLFSNLDRIGIMSRSSICIEAGGLPQCKKRFKSEYDYGTGPFYLNPESVEDVLSTLKEVREFVGCGLTEFRLSGHGRVESQGSLESQGSPRLVEDEELHHSKLTLQHFGYKQDSDEGGLLIKTLAACNFFLSCKNLTSAAIDLSPSPDFDGLAELRLPEDPPIQSLRELYLSNHGTKLPWAALAERFGNELEKVILKDNQLLPLQSTVIPFLSHFSQSLKYITFSSRVEVEEESNFEDQPSEISFPHLEYLRFSHGSPSYWSFFSRVCSPKLYHLVFNSNYYAYVSADGELDVMPEGASQLRIDCFMSLLKARHHTLTSSIFFDFTDDEEKLKDWEEGLCFPKLDFLQIQGLVGAFGKAFSKFQFPPALEDLDISDRFRSLYPSIPL